MFDVALVDLLADGVFAEELWAVPGRPGIGGEPGGEFPVWFFSVAGETVWGATARVLTELLCLVLGVPEPPSTTRALNRTVTGLAWPLGSGYGPRAQAVSWRMVGGRSVGAAAAPEVRRTATRVRRAIQWLS